MMRLRLLLLPLLLYCAAPLWAADDPAEDPPDTLASQDAHGPVMPDELAAWCSPAAGPLLTDGEYELIRSIARRRLLLPGTRSRQLVVVPFETASGDPALSIAVLTRAAHGYQSRLLTNVPANELRAIRLVRLGHGHGHAPKVVVAERGGSGGFLTLRVFGASRTGQWRSVWTISGVYQGRYRFQPGSRPTMARVRRYIAGEVNAYPKGVWRETYVWRQGSFRLAGRQRVRLQTPPGPGEAARSLHARAAD